MLFSSELEINVLIVNSRTSVPLSEFRLTFSRSSGPGGQNVNKVNTKVTLHWNVQDSPSIDDTLRDRLRSQYPRRINKMGEMVIISQRYRDQIRNVEDCHEKLREIILNCTKVTKTRKVTRPTRASKARRLEEKKRNSQRKSMRKDIPKD